MALTTINPTVSSLPYDNLLINSDMLYWQRGYSINTSSSGTFTADRWKVVYENSGSIGNVSAIATTSETVLYPAPWYYMRLYTASGGGEIRLSQRVEDIRRLSNDYFTLSFWVRSSQDFAGCRITTERQYKPLETEWVPLNNTFSIGTDWTYLSFPFYSDDLTGKTLDFPSFLGIYICFPSVSATHIDIANIKLERGIKETPLIQRHPFLEYMLCAYYYQKSYHYDVEPATITYSRAERKRQIIISSSIDGIDFPIPMRASGTVKIYSPVTGSASKVRDATNNLDLTVSNLTYATGKGFTGITVSNTVQTGVTTNYHWTADAEI